LLQLVILWLLITGISYSKLTFAWSTDETWNLISIYCQEVYNECKFNIFMHTEDKTMKDSVAHSPENGGSKEWLIPVGIFLEMV